MFDVIVIGAGPAGVLAALRGAELGAQTALITRDEFGGMAANDGPVPVRTLAQPPGCSGTLDSSVATASRWASRSWTIPACLRACARWSTMCVRIRLREHVDPPGRHAPREGRTARFMDPHTIETDRGLRLQADKIHPVRGRHQPTAPIPGFELTATHSDAWA